MATQDELVVGRLAGLGHVHGAGQKVRSAERHFIRRQLLVRGKLELLGEDHDPVDLVQVDKSKVFVFVRPAMANFSVKEKTLCANYQKLTKSATIFGMSRLKMSNFCYSVALQDKNKTNPENL